MYVLMNALTNKLHKTKKTKFLEQSSMLHVAVVFVIAIFYLLCIIPLSAARLKLFSLLPF